MRPFHLAFPIRDKETTKQFYVELLGATVGREAEKWVDFNFFGHQLSAHVKPEECAATDANEVDGKQVPVRHFGIVLAWDDWHALAEKLTATNTDFIIEPYTRFEGEVGEQATLFIRDPSGNALEFKSFRDDTQLFAS